MARIMLYRPACVFLPEGRISAKDTDWTTDGARVAATVASCNQYRYDPTTSIWTVETMETEPVSN